MVKSSKILTVSYGTFSCTLEGFDDAFDTMKAIAEYFRDLAADDRYFGAEPPTPDADMLAKIAEREIARRVEARDTGDGIVLRPSLAAAAAGVATVPAVLPTEADAETPADPDPVAEEAAETSPEPAIEAATEDSDTVDAPVEDTPADFATIEDSADLVVTEEAGEIAKETSEENAADESAAEDDPQPEDDIAASDPAPVEEDVVSDIVDGDEAHSLSESPDVDAVEPLEQADIESVAAKLKRIRDVVAKTDDAPEKTVDYNEDEHAEEFLAATARDIEAALNEPSEAPAALEASEEVVEDEAVDLADDATDDGDDDVVEVAEDADADDEVDAAPEAAELDDEPASEIEVTDEDAFEEDPELTAEDDTPSELSAMFDAAEAAEDSGEDKGEHKPVRAQVIKMKRADLEAAIADRELEKAAEAEAQAADESPEDADETSLSDEEEAELQRELAEVEAEMADDPETGEAEAEPETDAEEPKADDEDDFDLFGDDEDEDDEETTSILANDRDVERLMTEADSQLDQPEAKGRRAAIAHLRAAVAAAKEERKVGASLTDTSDQTVDYKEDLANVVRPRRPESRPNRSLRPSDPAAGPLKLVAEQRIDLDQPAPAATGIVRPRRVSSRVLREQEAAAEAAATLEAAAPVQDDDGFAAYAEQMGASELPELLEAAAAYLSFVEGREQFSRPQLMTRVRQSYRGDFSREDGLRSFGQLLREGKIEKIKGGRFTVSDHIGFQPKARAAG